VDAEAESDEVVTETGGSEEREPTRLEWFPVALSRATAPWAQALSEPLRSVAAPLVIWVTSISLADLVSIQPWRSDASVPFPYVFYRQPGNRLSTGSQAHNMLPSRGRVGGACAPVVAAARGGGALASEVGGREADGPPNYEYRHVDPTGGLQQIPQARMRPAGLAVSARDDYVQISEKKGGQRDAKSPPAVPALGQAVATVRDGSAAPSGRRSHSLPTLLACTPSRSSPLFLLSRVERSNGTVSRGSESPFLRTRVLGLRMGDPGKSRLGFPAEYTLVRDHHQTKTSLSHHTCVLRLCTWDR
jgi:hypothetical protein